MDEQTAPHFRRQYIPDISSPLPVEVDFRALIEEVPAVIYIAPPDAVTASLYVSPQIEQLTGFPAQRFLENPTMWVECLHPADREHAQAIINALVTKGQRGATEYRMIARSGRVVWVRDELDFVRDDAGNIRFVRGVMLDITQQKEAEDQAHRSDERFRALVQNAPDVIMLLDANGVVTYCSPALERVLGVPESTVVARSTLDCIHADDRMRARHFLQDIVSHPEEIMSSELRCRHADGTYRVLEFTATNMLAHPAIEAIVINARDVTERQIFEEELQRQAFHDALTGLANRSLLMDRIEHALTRLTRSDRQLAVLFLDLDRFKVINDSLGHAAGDLLLIQVSERLQRCLRANDTLARLGGDEFVILIEDITDPQEVIRVTERVITAIHQPVLVEGYEAHVSACIGIALSGTTNADAGDLLRNADIAMYRAKSSGRDQFVVFDPSMNVFSTDRLVLEADLRHALERQELRLVYQPQVDLHSGEIVACEALIRWHHPQRGILSPAEFMPLAEEIGLAGQIGAWVLNEACLEARRWQTSPRNSSRRPARVSVNLSRAELEQPHLPDIIANAVQQAGIRPGNLRIEVAESAIARDTAAAHEVLERIRNLGFQIAVDDFGVGHASLASLTHLHANVVKIDRSFVTLLESDPRLPDIFSAIVSLAHALDMEVVAEGIETEEQFNAVRRAGCDHAQGYFIAVPAAMD